MTDAAAPWTARSRLAFAGANVVMTLATGATIGLWALAPALVRAGTYGWRCSAADDRDSIGMCRAQRRQFAVLFGATTVSLNALALPIGLAVDVLGPVRNMLISVVGWFASALLFALHDGRMQPIDWYAVGYVGMTLSGLVFFLTLLKYPPVPPLSTLQQQTWGRGCLTAAWDLGALTYVMLNALAMNAGVPVRLLLVLYAVIVAVVMALVAVLVLRNSADAVTQVELPSLRQLLGEVKVIGQHIVPNAAYLAVCGVATIVVGLGYAYV